MTSSLAAFDDHRRTTTWSSPAMLFTIGAVGLLTRRNVLVMFMCVELMLNAVNLTFVSFAHELNDIRGQVIVFFVLSVAAAEVAVGLAIIVAIFRRRRGATADDLDLLKDPSSMSGTRDLLDLVWIVPALPLFGAVVLLLFGKRIGEPIAGWIATGLMMLSFVASLVMFFAMLDLPNEVRVNIDHPVHVDAGRHPARRHGLLRRPAVGHLDPARHRRRHADPPLLDRVHARRRALQPLLRLPEPVRRLDADARARLELPRHLPRVGGRRPLLVPARSRSGSSATPPRSRARRRSSPTASATSASCWRCS